MSNQQNEFVGPGKVFATEEEEFAEYIEMMEWATQSDPRRAYPVLRGSEELSGLL
jgi:hypothetical protein